MTTLDWLDTEIASLEAEIAGAQRSLVGLSAAEIQMKTAWTHTMVGRLDAFREARERLAEGS